MKEPTETVKNHLPSHERPGFAQWEAQNFGKQKGR